MVAHLLAGKLGSVAGGWADAIRMPTSLLLTLLAVVGIGVAATVLLSRPKRQVCQDAAPDVGVGTVQDGRRRGHDRGGERDGPEVHGAAGATMRSPRSCALALLLLVAFDPAEREQLSLADDMLAVRAAFDQMLVSKGLLTGHQLDLIRHGTRSRGVVTAMRDHR